MGDLLRKHSGLGPGPTCGGIHTPLPAHALGGTEKKGRPPCRSPSARASLAAQFLQLCSSPSPSPSLPLRTAQAPASMSLASTSGSMTARWSPTSTSTSGRSACGTPGVTWREIETSPGVYDWGLLDSYVRAAQQHHAEVTLVLAMTPSFYGPAPTLAPRLMSHYRDFVRAVMLRYRELRRAPRASRRTRSGTRATCPGPGPGHPRASPGSPARCGGSISRSTRTPPSWRRPSRCGSLSQRRWLSAYESQRVGGHPVRRYYDVNALSLYPKVTVRRSPRGARGRDADAGGGQAAVGSGRRTAQHAVVGQRGQLRGDRSGDGRRADLGAPPGGQRDPHVRPRRRTRAVEDVLVPLRLGPAVARQRRRHARQHAAVRPRQPGRAHTGGGRSRDGRALVARPVGRSERAPALRSRPARDLHVRREARQWCAADPVEPGPIGARPVPARSGRACNERASRSAPRVGAGRCFASPSSR